MEKKKQYSSCKPNYINYHSKCKCSKTLNGRYCQDGLKNKIPKHAFYKKVNLNIKTQIH